MTIPDASILSAFGLLAGYAAWMSRSIAKSYFDQVAKIPVAIAAQQKEAALAAEAAAMAHMEAAKAHKEAAKAHRGAVSTARQSCDALGEIMTLLMAENRTNGNGNR